MFDTNFNKAVEHSASSNHSLFIEYSCHDFTLISFLVALGYSYDALQTIPYYGSCVIVELYQNDTDSTHFYYNFYFEQNETKRTDPFNLIALPKCNNYTNCSADVCILIIPFNSSSFFFFRYFYLPCINFPFHFYLILFLIIPTHNHFLGSHT